MGTNAHSSSGPGPEGRELLWGTAGALQLPPPRSASGPAPGPGPPRRAPGRAAPAGPGRGGAGRSSPGAAGAALRAGRTP